MTRLKKKINVCRVIIDVSLNFAFSVLSQDNLKRQVFFAVIHSKFHMMMYIRVINLIYHLIVYHVILSLWHDSLLEIFSHILKLYTVILTIRTIGPLFTEAVIAFTEAVIALCIRHNFNICVETWYIDTYKEYIREFGHFKNVIVESRQTLSKQSSF